MMFRIDINCDLGECNDEVGLDRELNILRLVSSVNVCCGFHSGKTKYIEKIIEEAVSLGLNIGAHPSYPDRRGFGRRPMEIVATELKNLLIIQIERIWSMVDSKGGKLTYVKPHGALYNKAVGEVEEAQVIVDAVKEFSSKLAIVGLPNCALSNISTKNGLRYIPEGFVDRNYNSKGGLVARTEVDALIEIEDDAVIQAGLLVKDQCVLVEGQKIPMKVDTLCVHGDHTNSLKILSAIVKNFSIAEIEIRSFTE